MRKPRGLTAFCSFAGRWRSMTEALCPSAGEIAMWGESFVIVQHRSLASKSSSSPYREVACPRKSNQHPEVSFYCKRNTQRTCTFDKYSNPNRGHICTLYIYYHEDLFLARPDLLIRILFAHHHVNGCLLASIAFFLYVACSLR